VLVGFQAEGTRGREFEHATPHVKMFGEDIVVRAEIVELSSRSRCNADANELVECAAGSARPPGVVYTVHGEPDAAAALCSALADLLDRLALAPRYLERVTIRRTRTSR
jgi:metallo-beta-lactamase family protein